MIYKAHMYSVKSLRPYMGIKVCLSFNYIHLGYLQLTSNCCLINQLISKYQLIRQLLCCMLKYCKVCDVLFLILHKLLINKINYTKSITGAYLVEQGRYLNDSNH